MIKLKKGLTASHPDQKVTICFIMRMSAIRYTNVILTWAQKL